ncbi:MAG: hypothetical protein ACK56F_17745, partial [bacterium]
AVQYLLLFKIVYNTPHKVNPLNPTAEEKKADIGPIAFRMVFKAGDKMEYLDGCHTISRNLGNKRSASHYCLVN